MCVCMCLETVGIKDHTVLGIKIQKYALNVRDTELEASLKAIIWRLAKLTELFLLNILIPQALTQLREVSWVSWVSPY